MARAKSKKPEFKVVDVKLNMKLLDSIVDNDSENLQVLDDGSLKVTYKPPRQTKLTTRIIPAPDIVYFGDDDRDGYLVYYYEYATEFQWQVRSYDDIVFGEKEIKFTDVDGDVVTIRKHPNIDIDVQDGWSYEDPNAKDDVGKLDGSEKRPLAQWT